MDRIIALFKNLKFTKKLFISYSIVCIIPLVVLGYYSYTMANNFILQQAKQGMNQSAIQIEGNINFRCKQYGSTINSITQNIKFRQIFSDNFNTDDYPTLYKDYVDPFFSNILDLNKDILQISVLTECNDIQRGEYILPLKLVDGFSWLDSTKNSEDIQWYSENSKIFSTKLFKSSNSNEKNKKLSILFLSIDPDILFKDFSNIKLASYGVIIYNTSNDVIFSKNKNISTLPNYKVLSSTNLKNNMGQFKLGGKNFMLVSAEIPETKWRMYYYSPISDITVDATSIVGITALITVICMLSLIFVIWIFSNTFGKSLRKLNDKMQLVENGNLKIDVYSSSKDEIGELTNRFGKMLNNINQLIEEVYQNKIIQKEAELKILQSQINPHFLYNTLSIINWKALEIDATEISRITTTVSRFYRTVLNKGKNSISIKDEIENAKAYMEIQLIMHNFKFDFICDIKEEIFQYEMINLVLQPILENALEHGIDMRKRDSGRGKLILCGKIIGDDIEFSISDNGPGIDAEIIPQLLETGSIGYGLKNVHDRIRIRFGTPYGIVISSDVMIGTTVYITIPKYK